GCGVASLLPIDAISISRISHPRDRLRVGMDVCAVILSMDDGRICLSQRELLGTWEQNVARFAQGETVMGIVRSIEPYGVFIELSPNLAGLAEPRGDLVPGQMVSVYIKSILADKMKVKLIIIDVGGEAPPPAAPDYYITDGHIDRFVYSPPSADRRIEMVF
ncbi:MAG: 30S ribosomal protein S1, partial [Clostridia bacterium]|nr:30S ribosomal protein S1 [Clostridia bacterium]